MSDMNRIMLSGRLGKDPELTYTQSGTPRCKFSFATSKVTGSGDDRKERTDWHRIVVWGKKAEVVSKYLAKGDYCLLEGELTYFSFEDQNTGQKVTLAEVNAFEVHFTPGSKTRKGGGGGGQSSGAGTPQGGQDGGAGGPDDDDSIPF